MDIAELAAEHGTPCYVYSVSALLANWHAFDDAFEDRPHRVCYAVKANSNLAVLEVMASCGSGFDIVSSGELERVRRAGGRADRVVFSGVGKGLEEMRSALQEGIGSFNVESRAELEQLARVAGDAGQTAPVMIRVRPDISAGGHHHISTGAADSKFGIPMDEVVELCRWASEQPALNMIGLACHIGSQITELAPFREAAGRLVALADQCRKSIPSLQVLDMGGGLGIRYDEEQDTVTISDYVEALVEVVPPTYELWIEPGRAIAGPAGILLTRVLYIKETGGQRFAVVDAGMNDLLRPALYGAHHRLCEVIMPSTEAAEYDVVGPVCETADCFLRAGQLRLKAGDFLAIMDAGAYGSVMASNYNTRPRPCELLVHGDRCHIARRRENYYDLLRDEKLWS